MAAASQLNRQANVALGAVEEPTLATHPTDAAARTVKLALAGVVVEQVAHQARILEENRWS